MAADLVARVERTCARDLDAKQLRIEVLRDLAVVGFDAHVWALTDPVTRVGTSPLATVPGLQWPRLPDLVRTRYLSRTLRWTTLLDTHRSVDTLCHATGGDLDQSPLWRAMLRELGVTDVVLSVFADRFGCWGWLDLWRFSPHPPFQPGDVARLAELAPILTTALRRCEARSFGQSAPAGSVGAAVVMLGPDMHVRGQTPDAQAQLFRLNPPDPRPDGTPVGVPAIPAAAYNVAAQLIAREQGVDDAPARSRVHVGLPRWVTLKADRIAGPGPREERDIVVTIEESSVADRLDLFSRCHGLTRRENELLAVLLQGKATRAIAAELFLSEHTVNDHVKAILAKTGCANRQVLLARIAG
ncbi:MAG TPA: helix-turn-helix transcriptional regulator [Aldersonia sp.]